MGSDNPLAARQPPPTVTDEPYVQPMLAADIRARFTGAVADQLVDAVEARMAHGIEEYGTGLQASNGRDPMIDALQEHLDLVAYLRQAVERGLPAAGIYERQLELLVDTAEVWRAERGA